MNYHGDRMTSDNTSDTLSWLQHWYQAQANGDWEHQHGISITTIDNPGWRVAIELRGTSLATKSFCRLETENSESDWMHCWIDGDVFNIACGSLNLTRALSIFRDWVEDKS